MISSMTGFGRFSDERDGFKISVEIKSVNSRGLECSIKLPRAFSSLEENVKAYITGREISRGKIDIFIDISGGTTDNVKITLDEGYAKGYIEALRLLRDKFGLTDDISVMSVAQNTNLFIIDKQERDTAQDWQMLLPVLCTATDDFIASRKREGENLRVDFEEKLGKIEYMLTNIEKISRDDISSYRSRLEEKLHTALNDNKITVDENRILTECAIFADRIAIDEETVRLRSHLDTFRIYINGNESAGRKLNFLQQEIGREINTIGSKCSNSVIARLVVEMKSEAEKLREQIQNAE